MTWNLLEAPFTLKQGTLYACMLKLSFGEKIVATADMVAQKFTDAGFTGVTVDMNVPRAEGTWGQPDDAGVTLPSEVVTVWRWDP
jgi:hypothetical protein